MNKLMIFTVFALTAWAAPATTLNKTDTKIARYTAFFANNRFVDEVDDKGMALFLIARKLRPEAEIVTMLEASLQDQDTPKVLKVKTTERKFIRYVLKKTMELMPKKEGRKVHYPNKCLAYFRLVELYYPDNKDVVAGLKTLKDLGYDGSLATAVEEEWSNRKLNRGITTKKIEFDTSFAKSKGLDPKKLKIDVSRTKSKATTNQGLVGVNKENIELLIKIKNKNASDYSNLKLTVFVIGKCAGYKPTRFFVANKASLKDITIPGKEELKLPTISTIFSKLAGNHAGLQNVINGVEGEYQSWLLCLYDENDKQLISDASDATTRKLSDKILDFGKNDIFDRKGKKIVVTTAWK